MTNFMPAKHASKSEKNMLVLYNSRLCTKGGMVAIVTSAKCTRPSVARAVFTRVTSPPCCSRYTRRFVSKLVEKVALRASAQLAAGSQVSGGMNILPVEAGGMNISRDSDAEAQLTACRSTRKHVMRLFPPVWTQKYIHTSVGNCAHSACERY